MFRVAAVIVLFLTLIAPVAAQEARPDYAIRNIRERFSSDGTEAIVEFEVVNTGGAATQPASVDLALIATGEVIDSDTLNPLPAQGQFTITFVFQTNLFSPGSIQSLRAAVSMNEPEVSDRNNFGQISITFPEVTAEATAEATPEVAPIPRSSLEDVLRPINRVFANFDPSNPVHIAVAAGIGGAVLLLLLLLAIILRLLFQRTPQFGNYQPPYANTLPVDPNTTIGRRQQWQQHAQNSALPNPCVDANTLARKLLIGVDGGTLTGWRVKAIRMSQYDMYGRVARSQALASGRWVKRLDGAVRKSGSMDVERVARRVRPVAIALVKEFGKRLNQRNSMLPVALDIRFQGTHGDVRIVFELYQCQYGQWQKLDGWEPEMTVVGKTIYESYTYNLHGLSPGESLKDFRRRLADNLTAALAEMIKGGTVQAMAEDTPTSPGQMSVNI
jgi:hypothetical protein